MTGSEYCELCALQAGVGSKFTMPSHSKIATTITAGWYAERPVLAGVTLLNPRAH